MNKLNIIHLDSEYLKVPYDYHDYECIMNYLVSQGGESLVDNIGQYSGAHPLRLFPTLFRMEKKKVISVVKKNGFGAPVVVRLMGG